MATIRRLTDIQLASIGTTKVIALNTAGYTFQISSGNRAFEATNLGAAAVLYGDSLAPLQLGTGGLIVSTGAKFWDTITDNFTMTFATSGGTALLVLQEYAGN